jgi:hypothetical protein
MPLLDHAAELLPQFVGPQLDDRVMGHSLNRPVGSIQIDRDFGRFGEQPSEFFLKWVGVPLHGNPPNPRRDGSQDHHVSRSLPQMCRVPLLTFLRSEWKAQKLTCTRTVPRESFQSKRSRSNSTTARYGL